MIIERSNLSCMNIKHFAFEEKNRRKWFSAPLCLIENRVSQTKVANLHTRWCTRFLFVYFDNTPYITNSNLSNWHRNQ